MIYSIKAMIAEIIKDSLPGAILISGLVVIMMMMVECLNIQTRGSFFSELKKNPIGQVIVSAVLGVIPGCMGGFASVSLYAHGMFSFGALVAMMIASSGDEAFAMLAMFPEDSMKIFAILLIIAIASGLAIDFICKKWKIPIPSARIECHEMTVHEEDITHHSHKDEIRRRFGWKRVSMIICVTAFIIALGFGLLEHDGEEAEKISGLNLLDESWMNILFSVLSIGVLGVLIFANDHFVNEHLFEHVICRHLPRIFAWTTAVLLLLGILTNVFDISCWISGNTVLMILLAAAIGIIPESGPHLIFVTLYASGVIPMPVLLASCISQDGHASLPLLAESRKDFIKAKVINFIIAVAAGLICMVI